MKKSRLLVSSFAALSLATVSGCVTDPNTGQQKVSRTAIGAVGGAFVLPGLYDGHSRTFFFADYTGIKERRGVTTVNTVPTAATRTGDFSDYRDRNGNIIPIYDPLTTRLEGGRVVRDPFPNNIIPANRINPVGRNIASVFPLPNAGSGSFDNYISTPDREITDHAISGRVDHRLSDSDSFFVRFNYGKYRLDAPQGQAAMVDGGYRVTGRWAFASGCQHCAWLMGGSVVLDGAGPRRGPDGLPLTRLMLAPAAEVQVIDTWSVSGLRGTGSHDIAFTDVFVPAARSVSLASDRPHAGGPLGFEKAPEVLLHAGRAAVHRADEKRVLGVANGFEDTLLCGERQLRIAVVVDHRDQEVPPRRQCPRLRVGHVAELGDHPLDPRSRLRVEQRRVVDHPADGLLGNPGNAGDIVDRRSGHGPMDWRRLSPVSSAA